MTITLDGLSSPEMRFATDLENEIDGVRTRNNQVYKIRRRKWVLIKNLEQMVQSNMKKICKFGL